MRTATVHNFKGIADDRFAPLGGEFAIAKHFDTLTHPRRLQPLRSMIADATGTLIGNIIVATNGQMYAVGTAFDNPTLGELYVRSGYSTGNQFQSLVNRQLSGQTVVYDLLVDYKEAGQVRTIYWASNNTLAASDPAGASSADTQALTFSSIGQGLVHPKDKILYIPYRTSTAQYIATVSPNAASFGAFDNGQAWSFAFPTQYRAYCLSYYGNYLAVPQTTPAGTTQLASLVYLWSRDKTLSGPDDLIPWGEGSLQVLNNVGGSLVGISTYSANVLDSFQDFDSILIKVWNGGPEPELVAELKAMHLAGSGNPRCTINPRVNFVSHNRLYFSVKIDPGDSIQPVRQGLFSVGKNKIDGRWSVNLERISTPEGNVIAAALSGDSVAMVYDAVGNVVKTISGPTASSTHTNTSVYESGVNPGMDEEDKYFDKKLYGVRVNHLPLPANASVVLKYRINSNGADTDWLTVYSQTTPGETGFKTSRATLAQFSKGRDIEWRIESMGGAVVTGFTYYYDPVNVQL